MSTFGVEPRDSTGSIWSSALFGRDRTNIELRGIFLRRLRRLLQLRRNHEGQLNYEGTRLLDRSIYATYCDCVSVGSLEAAQEVIRRSSLPVPTTPDNDHES
jgi:hypothetical protein